MESPNKADKVVHENPTVDYTNCIFSWERNKKRQLICQSAKIDDPIIQTMSSMPIMPNKYMNTYHLKKQQALTWDKRCQAFKVQRKEKLDLKLQVSYPV